MEAPGAPGVVPALAGAVVAGLAAFLGLAYVPAVAAAAEVLRRSAERVGRRTGSRYRAWARVVVGGVAHRWAVAAVPGLAAARSAEDCCVGGRARSRWVEDCARCRIARPDRAPRPRTNRPRPRGRAGYVSTRAHRLDQGFPPRDNAPTGRDLRTVANARADRHPPTNLAFPSSLPPRPWLRRLRRFRNDNDSATTGHPSANRTRVGVDPVNDAEKLLGLGLLGSISIILAARKYGESTWFAILVRVSVRIHQITESTPSRSGCGHDGGSATAVHDVGVGGHCGVVRIVEPPMRKRDLAR